VLAEMEPVITLDAAHDAEIVATSQP